VFLIPGRVFAETREQAQELIIASITKRGLVPVRDPEPYKAAVQCWSGAIWWEHYTEVEECE